MFVIKVMGLKRTIQKCALWAVLMLASQVVSAQNEVQFSDYTRLKSYYNPAVSGTEGKLNVVAAYSMQFVGFEDAPKTMYVGADLPIFFLGPRHGAGASLMKRENWKERKACHRCEWWTDSRNHRPQRFEIDRHERPGFSGL